MVCLLQMSAILEPSPNLPRVCRTPYLVPDSTRPTIRGLHSSITQLNLTAVCHCTHLIHPTYPTMSAHVEPKSGRL